jgi:transposase-like protein
MKSRQQSREFWEKAVARAESSGRTRAVSAKELGVGLPALGYWIFRLRAERAGATRRSPAQAFVPVRTAQSRPVNSERLELEVGGVVVRFCSSTTPEYVAKLAGALRLC